MTPTIQTIDVLVTFRRALVSASKNLVILNPFKLYTAIVSIPRITSTIIKVLPMTYRAY